MSRRLHLFFDTLESRRLMSTVQVASASFLENAGDVTVPLTLKGSPASAPITISYQDKGVTALVGKDYSKAKGSVTIPAGQTTASIPLHIIDDNLYEGPQTFKLLLKAPKGVSITSKSITITIQDNESVPTVTLTPVSVTEGNKGIKKFSVTATLSAPTEKGATVAYRTANGTATTKDYKAVHGTIKFAAGKTSANISLSVFGDTAQEQDETFNVLLSNPKNARVGSASTTITILNDDGVVTPPTPTITVANTSFTEGDSGTTVVQIPVHLSSAAATDVTVHYATIDGTAVQGSDYIATAGTLTIPAGQTSANIPLSIINDTTVESSETLSLQFSSPAGAVFAGSASSLSSTITILDNDIAPAVSINWASVGDAGNAADTPINGKSFGAVAYDYQIATTDVTNSQYTAFLNAKDPSGSNTLGLYAAAMGTSKNAGGILFSSSAASGHKYSVVPGQDNKPVTYTTFYDALRFINWLNNGQGNGDTESGTYTLLGGTPTPSNAATITRNPNAQIFLPSEDEWYKAAYYKSGSTNAGYWKYATQSDTAPTSEPPNSSSSNSANYVSANGTYAVTGSTALVPTQNYLTDVGAYSNSKSAYGTFDQNGNVFQWNEGLDPNQANHRGVAGGSWNYPAWSIASSLRSNQGGSDAPDTSLPNLGFRVASLPGVV